MLQSGRSTAQRSAVLVSALLLIGCAAAWGGDDPKTKSPVKKAAAGRDNGGMANPLLAYDRRVQALYAVAQVLQMTHPLGAFGLLKADASLSLWQDFIHKLPPPESPSHFVPATAWSTRIARSHPLRRSPIETTHVRRSVTVRVAADTP